MRISSCLCVQHSTWHVEDAQKILVRKLTGVLFQSSVLFASNLASRVPQCVAQNRSLIINYQVNDWEVLRTFSLLYFSWHMHSGRKKSQKTKWDTCSMMEASSHLSWNSFWAKLRTSDKSLTCLVGNFVIQKSQEMKEGTETPKKKIEFWLLRGNW